MNNSEDSDICSLHKEFIDKICVNAECSHFKPLCLKCIKSHNSNHSINEMLDYSYEKSETSKTYARAKIEIEELRESITNALESIVETQEEKLDDIFVEIDKIQNEVFGLFKEFKDEITKEFRERKVKVVKGEISAMDDDLIMSMEFFTKNSKNTFNAEFFKEIFMLDLDYQMRYKRNKVKELIRKKEDLKFNIQV